MENKSAGEPTRVLHLSDLHLGLIGQDWMWPTFRTALYEDLRNMHARTGPWDLVIFSGDLTQQAGSDEFDQLTRLLIDLWEHIKGLGSVPKLFVVPGNHDLARPAKMDPAGKVMTAWWDDAAVQADFWKSSDSHYRQAVAKWFENYEAWVDQVGTAIPFLATVRGILPGDVAATFQKGSNRIGLIGLNSAWLQCAGGDFLGRLCVHPRQLMGVTANAPDAWCARHDFRLLITHHPLAWLHPTSQKLWAEELNTDGRFDAHLFGHMHEARSRSTSISGGPIRHEIQAASLFGLESYGEDKIERSHGYAVIQIPAVGGARSIRIWPRILRKKSGASPRLVADQDWLLTEDNYCDLVLDPVVGTTISEGLIPTPAPEDRIDPLAITTGIKDVLARLTRPVAFNEAHAAVRKGERSVFLAALKEKRQAWLVTDWGLAGDEFIYGVQLQLLGRRGPIYYLDLHKFHTQEEVVEGLSERIGCGFTRLCSGLADEGEAILVLDDVELEQVASATGDTSAIAQQIQGLVQVILDYCPELCVIVRSRSAPSDTSLQVIELTALDEPDTALYLGAHPKGGAHLTKPDAAGRLHRHTDGIPFQIDIALKEMDVVGLRDLLEIDTDVAGKQIVNRDVSPSLARTIQELAEARDDVSSRAYALLKVLAMFPQGEQYARVRRFFGTRAFFPGHATRLVELALVEAVSVSLIGNQGSIAEDGRALVVRRPVREYIIRSLSDAELRTLSSKALSLYFGDEWELRGIRTPADLKFKDSRCSAREIGNACTMILRATRAALGSGLSSKAKTALALATAFVAQLISGDHYRSVAGLYDDLLPLHERSGLVVDLDLELARVQYAQALRMIGECERSRELLKICEKTAKTKAMRQQVLLGLALASQSLKVDRAEIVDIAQRAQRIDPKTNLGLQAKAIAISNDDANLADRDNQLLRLQEEAIKRKAFVVSNNLAIERAAKVKDPERKKAILQEAVQNARRENEAYNFIRASLELAQLSLNQTGSLTQEALLDCTRAYSYLFNQRMDWLFNKCHDILWRHFMSSKSVDNMLELFRQSSLVWRLKDQVAVERRFITQLLPLLGQGFMSGILTADRKLLYFMTRSIQLSIGDTALVPPKAVPPPALPRPAADAA
ncbi:MAG: metallophosphoesterase [Rubrivivax sp.]|nr:MAG: metallophosphoesterase [Rubrivivax sp.]